MQVQTETLWLHGSSRLPHSDRRPCPGHTHCMVDCVCVCVSVCLCRYVRGRLPGELAKELGVYQANPEAMPVVVGHPHTPQQPTQQNNTAPATPAAAATTPAAAAAAAVDSPAAAAGALSPTRRRRAATGMHADLMAAVHEGLTSGMGPLDAAARQARSGNGAAMHEDAYVPAGFKEFIAKHGATGLDLTRAKEGLFVSRSPGKTAANKAMHDFKQQLTTLAVSAGGLAQRAGQEGRVGSIVGGMVGGVSDMDEQPVLRPATVALPLSRAEARRRWGAPSQRPASRAVHSSQGGQRPGKPAQTAAATHQRPRNAQSLQTSPVVSPRGPLVPSMRCVGQLQSPTSACVTSTHPAQPHAVSPACISPTANYPTPSLTATAQHVGTVQKWAVQVGPKEAPPDLAVLGTDTCGGGVQAMAQQPGTATHMQLDSSVASGVLDRAAGTLAATDDHTGLQQPDTAAHMQPKGAVSVLDGAAGTLAATDDHTGPHSQTGAPQTDTAGFPAAHGPDTGPASPAGMASLQPHPRRLFAPGPRFSSPERLTDARNTDGLSTTDTQTPLTQHTEDSLMNRSPSRGCRFRSSDSAVTNMGGEEGGVGIGIGVGVSEATGRATSQRSRLSRNGAATPTDAAAALRAAATASPLPAARSRLSMVRRQSHVGGSGGNSRRGSSTGDRSRRQSSVGFVVGGVTGGGGGGEGPSKPRAPRQSYLGSLLNSDAAKAAVALMDK